MRSNDHYGQGHTPAREDLEGQVRKFTFDAAEKKETKGQVQKTPEAQTENWTMTLYARIYCHGAR